MLRPRFLPRLAIAVRRKQPGITIAEMLVVMVIVAILGAFATPSFSQFVANARIKSGAESIAGGLRLARAGAVQLNTQVRFQLTSSLADDCVLSMVDANWVISIDDASGHCSAAGVQDIYMLTDAIHNPPPRILKKFSSADGARSTAVAADQSALTFDGLGRLNPAPDSTLHYAISSPGTGQCKVQGGPVRCLQVLVSPGGQVRVCDPSYSGPDPRAC